MITTVGFEEAANRLGELLDRANRGEIVVITRDGSAIAQLTACLGMTSTTPDRRADVFERCHTGPDSIVDVTSTPSPRPPSE